YEGRWCQDKKHGEGMYVFEDGTLFQGQFKDDRPVSGITEPLQDSDDSWKAATSTSSSTSPHPQIGEALWKEV
ncbi:hypothetical protein, partial [Salmonella sp. NW715]|uniref:hypothetical protein n=1 Tax=Salmonella sp. NW715 TaxID=2948218 RepID=UPI003F41BE0A